MEEPCLICLSPSVPTSSSFLWLSRSTSGGKKEVLLRPHVYSVFVLRSILKATREQCGHLLRTTRLHPGLWFSLCANCSELVDQALAARDYREILKFYKVVQVVGAELRTKLYESLLAVVDKTEDCFGVKSAYQLVRDSFKEKESLHRLKMSDRTRRTKKRRRFEDTKKSKAYYAAKIRNALLADTPRRPPSPEQLVCEVELPDYSFEDNGEDGKDRKSGGDVEALEDCGLPSTVTWRRYIGRNRRVVRPKSRRPKSFNMMRTHEKFMVLAEQRAEQERRASEVLRLETERSAN